MNPVALIDALALLAALFSFIVLAARVGQSRFRHTWFALLAIVVLSLFNHISNVLEWSGITSALDGFEDYSGLLMPTIWFFFLFLILRERALDDFEKSEQRLRSVIESSPMGIHLYTLDERDRLIFTGYNPSATRIVGMDFSNSIGKPIYEAFAPLAETEIPDRYHAAARDGTPWQTTHVQYDSDEIRGAFEVHAFQTSPGKMAVMFQDITDRLKAERELTTSRERLELILWGAGLGTWDWDIPNDTITYNDRWMSMLGYEPGELVPTAGTWESLVHPEDLEQVQSIWESHLAGETDTYETEHRIQHKDGSWVWVLDKGRLIERDEHGKPLRACGTHLDITSRKLAQEQLAQQVGLLKETQRLTRVGGFLYDVETREFTWTEELYRIHGLEAETFNETETGLMETSLKCYDVEDRDVITQAFLNCVADGTAYDMEFPFTSVDGKRKWIRTTANAEYSDGKICRVIGNVLDITERKNAEEERLHLERQIQHAQKLESLGVLAGGIAHDFNNLLMGVLGNAELALQNLSPHSPARDNIDSIQTAAKRAAALAKQMLAYSGKGKFVIEALNINELITEMAHLLNVGISKTSQLHLNLSGDLPMVEGDPTQIRQVLMNLITNASEAIGDSQGRIDLTTGVMDCDDAYLKSGDLSSINWLEKPLEPGRYVFFEVSDSGEGMTRETLSRIFDPFFTTKFTGRGLGLAAVMGIVAGHMGFMKVYSEPGKGSTFKVLLPLHPDAGSTKRHFDPTESEVERSLKGGVILFADDEETVREVGRKLLQKSGFEVLLACDGQEAVELYRSEGDRIDCVILDLTMPNMDGKTAFREIKNIDPEARIVLSSGFNEQDVVQQFRGKGSAGFVQKPYTMADLKRALSEVMTED